MKRLGWSTSPLLQTTRSILISSPFSINIALASERLFAPILARTLTVLVSNYSFDMVRVCVHLLEDRRVFASMLSIHLVLKLAKSRSSVLIEKMDSFLRTKKYVSGGHISECKNEIVRKKVTDFGSKAVAKL